MGMIISICRSLGEQNLVRPAGASGKKTHLPMQETRDMGSIPGSGRSPGEGHGSSLQYSCLENPMDRGPWQAMIHRVSKSRTPLK